MVVAEHRRNPGATIVGLAARLRLHRETLGRIITVATGLSAGAWREEQIEQGVRRALMASPTDSIKEVAARFGFTTSGLRRFTVRRCGMTPTQLRRVRVQE